jgi:hypothetical protein
VPFGMVCRSIMASFSTGISVRRWRVGRYKRFVRCNERESTFWTLPGHQAHGDLDCGDFVLVALGIRWLVSLVPATTFPRVISTAKQMRQGGKPQDARIEYGFQAVK